MNRNSRNDFSGHDDHGRHHSHTNHDPTGGQRRNLGAHSQLDLLGFALGALDDRDAQRVNKIIQQCPDLEDELQLIRMSIEPLNHFGEVEFVPVPVGLARRACESVASYRSTNETLGSAFRNTAHVGLEFTGRSISRFDLIAIAMCVILMGSILFPVLQANRFYSRVIACQNNLREVGFALLRYADENGARFVPIPDSGNLAVAGVYAPTLIHQQMVDNDKVFFCAERRTSDNQARLIPSVEQIQTARGAALVQLQRLMGGDFGYSIGYFSEGRYTSPERLGRANFVLLADAPSNDLPGRASLNHNGFGQNCLFEDGHIALVRGSAIGSDAIYENDLGQIAPGAHQYDSVIAPSHVPAIGFRVMER